MDFKLLVVAITILVASGCTQPPPPPLELTQIGKDTYTNHNIPLYRTHLYKESARFCKQKNLELSILRERKLDNLIILDFKCLAQNSEEYKNSRLYEDPNIVTTQEIKAN